MHVYITDCFVYALDNYFCINENACSIIQNISITETENVLNTMFKNDPALIPQSASTYQQSYFVELGPCQPNPLDLPNNSFPKNYEKNGKFRSFHESYYYKVLPNQAPCRRWWLSYSTSKNKIFCISCKLFGLPKVKNNNLVLNGSGDWKNINRTIENHEVLPDHLHAEISRSIFTKNLRLDLKLTLVHSANQQIAENRQIIKAIIDALIFIARQNIALRGHDESHTSKNKGNFLELVTLLANYHAPLQIHLDKINVKCKNRLTFMSNITQNTLLNILKEQIRSTIINEIKKTKMFSVIIDTTTDVANLEQFTLIARYIYDGVIQERLIALVTADDGTGKGLFQVFCNIAEKHGLDWKKQLYAQSYDGAASMQGEYSGLRTLIQEENPKAKYIWCFAHRLNLVIVDTVDSSVNTRQFLGDLQSLIGYMRARKRTSEFVNYQKILQPTERTRRIKSFSNTRWTSHDRVITVIYEKYEALIKTLESLSSSTDRITSSGAKNFITIITTFNFVITMLLLKKIFSLTTPLSNYLQSKSLDFIEAQHLIINCIKQLKEIRNDKKYEELVLEAKSFCNYHSLNEIDFKEIRKRTKKILAGEKALDEIQLSSFNKYRCDTYFKVLDQVIISIQSRFSDSSDILKDLTLLSAKRLLTFKNECQSLPLDSFDNLVDWVPEIDVNQLRHEYIIFSKNFEDLIAGINLPVLMHEEESELKSSESSDEDNDPNEEEGEIITSISIGNIIYTLSKFDLLAAFPNLYMAYKILGTIPVSSASAERSFSKVSCIVCSRKMIFIFIYSVKLYLLNICFVYSKLKIKSRARFKSKEYGCYEINKY